MISSDHDLDAYREECLRVLRNITTVLGLKFSFTDCDPSNYEARILDAIHSLLYLAKRSPDIDNLQIAFGVLQIALANNSDYAWAWHCNIAMSAFNEGVDIGIANKIANRFMQPRFAVNTEDPALMRDILGEPTRISGTGASDSPVK